MNQHHIPRLHARTHCYFLLLAASNAFLRSFAACIARTVAELCSFVRKKDYKMHLALHLRVLVLADILLESEFFNHTHSNIHGRQRHAIDCLQQLQMRLSLGFCFWR